MQGVLKRCASHTHTMQRSIQAHPERPQHTQRRVRATTPGLSH
nr:MAG TPA: hypothetical protein [Caudoviricetes sp.]